MIMNETNIQLNGLQLQPKLPTMQELINQSETDVKENNLMVLLNQSPPAQWLKEYNGHPYLPIERVEYLLSRIFTKWWVEVRDTKVMANSVAVTIRLFVKNPITGEIDYQDGVGAAPIQTNKGATAMDIAQTKNDAVMKALPSAKSYAVKDAAELFGKVFGKDLSRKDQISYNELLKPSAKDTADAKERQRIIDHITGSKTVKQLKEVATLVEADFELSELFSNKLNSLK